MNDSRHSLPPNLPEPSDDGACSHLLGMRLPPIALPATTGEPIDLSSHAGLAVIYCYPATGTPGVPSPSGWDEFPGARGCTPQSCAYRDHNEDLQALGATVYGVSAQTTEAQQEAAERLELPFPLLSDAAFTFTRALRLPTFELEAKRYLKRDTFVVQDGIIEKVFYPVFPPENNAEEVIAWLRARRASREAAARMS